jgi:hypothetical protein
MDIFKLVNKLHDLSILNSKCKFPLIFHNRFLKKDSNLEAIFSTILFLYRKKFLLNFPVEYNCSKIT